MTISKESSRPDYTTYLETVKKLHSLWKDGKALGIIDCYVGENAVHVTLETFLNYFEDYDVTEHSLGYIKLTTESDGFRFFALANLEEAADIPKCVRFIVDHPDVLI